MNLRLNIDGKPLSKEQATALSPQVLAFVGDAVHTLIVRTKLSLTHSSGSGDLHKLAVSELSACAQSARMERLSELLSEEETTIFKRGRNTKVHSVAKNASVAQYKRATGYEALLGYLYLIGDTQRLSALTEFADGETPEPVDCRHGDTQ